MSDDDMTPEEYEEHVSGWEVDQEHISELEAQVTRLQDAIRRLTPEAGDDATREFMHGLNDGDLTPPK